MDTTLLAIRAVATEYARGLLWIALAAGLGVYTLFVLLIWWIATNAGHWWWLLLIIPTCALAVFGGLWALVNVVTRRIAPPMNAERRAATKQVIERINHVAEQLGTPRFVIFYRIAKDILMPPSAQSRTYIGEIASEPGEVKRAFDTLRALF